MLSIQPIATDDVAAVEQLAYDYNQELDPGISTRESVARWIATVSQETWSGKHFFWLARLNEQIIGFVSFAIRSNPFLQETYGFIEDMYIIPPFRRHGHAQELALAACAELSRQGAQRVQLDVLVHNQAALTFWQRLGLVPHHVVLNMPLPAQKAHPTH